jgi:hypothetical protein
MARDEFRLLGLEQIDERRLYEQDRVKRAKLWRQIIDDQAKTAGRHKVTQGFRV